MTGHATNPDADSAACSTLNWTILMRPGSARRTKPLSAASWITSTIWDILFDLPPAVLAFALPNPIVRIAEGCLCGGE